SNLLTVNTSAGAVLTDVKLTDGAGNNEGQFAGVNLDSATLIATNTSGGTVLDASAWTKPVALVPSAATHTLKGNADHVTFVALKPASGTVTVSLAAGGGEGNSLRLVSNGGDLSSLVSDSGVLSGITLGTHTANLGYVLDLGDGVVDTDLTV